MEDELARGRAMAIAVLTAVASVALALTLMKSVKGPIEPERKLVRQAVRWDCVDVMGGEYRVCINVWGTECLTILHFYAGIER